MSLQTEYKIGTEPVVKPNWYVITGGPSSGKTTTVNMLSQRGCKCRVPQREFRLGIPGMQIEQEKSISPNDVVFIDRAIPDAIACDRFLNT